MTRASRTRKLYSRFSNSNLGFYLRWAVALLRGYSSINNIDKKILKYLPQTPGYFVEVGGNDGIQQSNTFILEKRYGWRGLLVEPVPRLARRCKRSRSRSIVKNLALVSRENSGISIEMIDLGLMTFVSRDRNEDNENQIINGVKYSGRNPKKFEIKGDTLSSVLFEVGNPQIDFFSLDVEGYELEVLSGLDLRRHRPKLILIETMNPEAVRAILGSFYELVEQLSHHDYLYRLKS